MDSLFELFPDHYPYLLSETVEEFVFGLGWPSDPDWFIDPHLTLQSRLLFNCSLEQLLPFCQWRQCRSAPFLFSMFHSRALLAPASAFAGKDVNNFSHIVHVDDHNDLMAPLVRLNGRTLVDAVSNTQIDLDDVESVTSAIDRGAIHKGNFLSAYVLTKPSGLLIYVNERIPTSSWSLLPTEVEIKLGNETLLRNDLICSTQRIPETWRLDELPSLPLDLDLGPSDSVWLDVDLDAFCNRYDGDSDRRAEMQSDHENQSTQLRIRNFLSALEKASWTSHIRAVSVAASPSFFPSDYWNWAIPEVCNGIQRLVCGE